ncbi:inositol monophosphatase family protein [Tuberibacillus sp. Marseille-P3662]|uniref:inositol monophosphatase family protein n=1 Tax=Tuberibacillus sp. Marseille-P3662 TaxID=1965358 RepID=UPI000A1CAA48|nr:inositol monophosphatase family protein [Tuberibacillus sp. Marseille-P3662]
MVNEAWHDIYKQAKAWIYEAGEILKTSLAEQLDVQFKSSHDDLVTNMDKRIEQFFIERIHKHYPEHKIVSEEGFGDEVDKEHGTLWLIDPIDGTMNFVHQKRHFAVSIGIYEHGKGRIGLIYDVMADDLYHCLAGEGAYLNDTLLPSLEAVPLNESVICINTTWVNENRRIDPDIMRPIAAKCRGTRSYGSAAIELAYVATGILDAYFTMRLAPWDYGAGLILLNEVDGIATRADGSPIDLLKQNSILAGRPSVYHDLSKHIESEVAGGKHIDKS